MFQIWKSKFKQLITGTFAEEESDFLDGKTFSVKKHFAGLEFQQKKMHHNFHSVPNVVG